MACQQPNQGPQGPGPQGQQQPGPPGSVAQPMQQQQGNMMPGGPRPPMPNHIGGLRQPGGVMANIMNSPPMGANRMATPTLAGQMFQQGEMTVSSSGNDGMLRKQLEQPGSMIRPPNASQGGGHLNALLHQGPSGQVAQGNAMQGGPSLLESQLAKQTASDPNPELINKVATCHASKVPNDSLHPLMPNNQMIKQEDIKEEIKSEIKEEPIDNDSNASLDIKPNMIKNEVKTEIKTEESKPSIDAKPVTSTAVTPVAPPMRVTFTKEELKAALEPPLMKMYNQEPEAGPFREPVDPDTLGIPDYFQIIKTPMDLSTIKKKLDDGAYKEPWEFVDDVWLMFENAWTYNKKQSRVFKFCSKVNKILVFDVLTCEINGLSVAVV